MKELLGREETNVDMQDQEGATPLILAAIGKVSMCIFIFSLFIIGFYTFQYIHFLLTKLQYYAEDLSLFFCVA